MKVLFIGSCFDKAGGGYVIAKRNLKVLCNVFGKDNVSEYLIAKSSLSIGNIVNRIRYNYVGGLTKDIMDAVLSRIDNFDMLWIDGSCFGALAKVLKDNGYKGHVVCFFHNIERSFTKVALRNLPFYPIKYRPIYEAENDAIFYSDTIVTLTERDAAFVRNKNPKASIVLLPSSLPDTYEDGDSVEKSSKILTLLFVGSYFYANVHGIEWFVNKVLPFVDTKLVIVGAGMEKLSFSPSPKLEIHGFVEDLGYYYRNCDVVVAPIFEGSGMKTKTAEALMWGKFVIGTNEAFCVFDICEECGIVCCSAEDFIMQINSLIKHPKAKFIPASRSLFLNKYSLECSENIIKSLVKF